MIFRVQERDHLGCRKHGVSEFRADETQQVAYRFTAYTFDQCPCCGGAFLLIEEVGEWAQTVRQEDRRHLFPLRTEARDGGLCQDCATAERIDRLRMPEGAGDAVGGAGIHLPAAFAEAETDWAAPDDGDDWLIPGLPVLPYGRSTSIFAPAGTGKSAVAQWLGATASGGNPAFPLRVPILTLWLDREQATSDWRGRWQAMGIDPTKLEYFKRYAFPNIAPLNTAAGCEQLLEFVRAWDGEGLDILLIQDSRMRFLSGDENASDTFNDYEKGTGGELKKMGITTLILDHSASNDSTAARGSTAKRDTVDLEWKLSPRSDGLRLTRTKERIPWIPKTVDLRRPEGTLRFELVASSVEDVWPDGTGELADLMDELEIPLEYGRPRVLAALKEAGKGARNDLVAAAIKYRKQASNTSKTVPGTGAVRVFGDSSRDSSDSESGDTPGTGRDSARAVNGDRGGVP